MLKLSMRHRLVRFDPALIVMGGQGRVNIVGVPRFSGRTQTVSLRRKVTACSSGFKERSIFNHLKRIQILRTFCVQRIALK